MNIPTNPPEKKAAIPKKGARMHYRRIGAGTSMRNEASQERSPEPVDHESSDVPIDSVSIRRLIEEVRGEALTTSRSYNRTYNRHNR